MTTLITISLVVFLSYLFYILREVGVPTSLSNTFYTLNKGWLFQVAMFISAASLLPVLFEATNNSLKILEFLTCGGVLFVAAAPAFKLELEGKVHIWGALISGLAGILWVIISGHWYILLMWVIPLAYQSITEKDKRVFYLEMITFGTVYTTAIAITIS